MSEKPSREPLGEITRFLRRYEEGDRAAIADLLPLVYEQLHRISLGQMASERADHTLQPTALLNEAYLRLARGKPKRWADRSHFLRAAATVMRSILLNHARDRRRIKRGGGARKLELPEAIASATLDSVDLIALDEALEKLEGIDSRLTEMIELRFYAGLTVRETAEVMGASERSLHRDWSLARAWLVRELGERPEDPNSPDNSGDTAGEPEA